MNEIANNNTSSTAKVNYILQIVTTLTAGITGIIAVIIAYVNKDDADDWLQTHYRFQIRTFWIGTLYSMLGLFLSLYIIGYIILIFTFFWLVIRCAKGLKQLENNEPVKNVESWLFS